MAVSGESRPDSLDNTIILDQVRRPPHLDCTQSFKGDIRRQSTQYQLIESNEMIRRHCHSTTVFDVPIDTLASIPLTNATLEFALLVYLLSSYLSLPGMLQAISRISQTSAQSSSLSLASARSTSMLTWHSPGLVRDSDFVASSLSARLRLNFYRAAFNTKWTVVEPFDYYYGFVYSSLSQCLY
jgi:hypothetical protein